MELAYETLRRVRMRSARCHNVIRSLSERRDITLSTTSQPADLEIRADKSKFKQVMYNLLSNAIKFTPAGGKVWVTRARSSSENLVVEVGDTGVGIPAEHQELHLRRVLPGRRRDHPPERGHRPGALADPPAGRAPRRARISRRERAGASGSVFTFRHTPVGVDGENGHARNRILLIEDNASNRELARMVLIGNGFGSTSPPMATRDWRRPVPSSTIWCSWTSSSPAWTGSP